MAYFEGPMTKKELQFQIEALQSQIALLELKVKMLEAQQMPVFIPNSSPYIPPTVTWINSLPSPTCGTQI